VNAVRDKEEVPMVKKGGRLIAIEGIDQAGKRTQSYYLAADIRKVGVRASVWNFPDYTTPLGKQLKAYLQGRVHLDLHSVHLLYAANKWEVADDLRRRLERGEVAIVNRYSPSNIAYGIAHGLAHSWLVSLEEGLPQPNLVVVLDIPPRISAWRKKTRRDAHEVDLKYLEKVRRQYLQLAARYGWKIIDGQQDPETVRRLVRARVTQVLEN
jgi:dTMP kinase